MSEEQIPYQTEKYSSINLNFKFKFMQLKEDNISEFKEFFKKNLGCYNYICNYDKNNKSINIFQTNKIEMFETIQEIKINPDQVLKTHEFWEELIEDTIELGNYLFVPEDTRLTKFYSIIKEGERFNIIDYKREIFLPKLKK